VIEKKGLGGKRICRVGINLTNKTNNNLQRLATSCGMSKASFAAMIIERCLSDPLMVSQLQAEFNVNPAYRVIVVRVGGEVELRVQGW
jgi:hypothetical protein